MNSLYQGVELIVAGFLGTFQSVSSHFLFEGIIGFTLHVLLSCEVFEDNFDPVKDDNYLHRLLGRQKFNYR